MELSCLCAKLPDWEQVLVYSDYLEDQGREVEAEGIRWLVVNQRWPFHHYYKPPWESELWQFYNCENLEQGRPHPDDRQRYNWLPGIFREALGFSLSTFAANPSDRELSRKAFTECLTLFLCGYAQLRHHSVLQELAPLQNSYHNFDLPWLPAWLAQGKTLHQIRHQARMCRAQLPL